MNKAQAAKLADLKAKYETALAAVRANRTQDTQQAAVAASAELCAYASEVNPQKRGASGGRAGKRQWDEMRAQYGKRRA